MGVRLCFQIGLAHSRHQKLRMRLLQLTKFCLTSLAASFSWGCPQFGFTRIASHFNYNIKSLNCNYNFLVWTSIGRLVGSTSKLWNNKRKLLRREEGERTECVLTTINLRGHVEKDKLEVKKEKRKIKLSAGTKTRYLAFEVEIKCFKALF